MINYPTEETAETSRNEKDKKDRKLSGLLLEKD